MKHLKLSIALLALAALSACGGGGSDEPQQHGDQATSEPSPGYWEPANPANDTYELHQAPTEYPHAALKTGRSYRDGKLHDRFSWDVQADGAIKMQMVGNFCQARPLNLCPVLSTTRIANTVDTSGRASWTVGIDANADGTIDSTRSDTYSRKQLRLDGMKDGAFYLTRTETFDLTTIGAIKGSMISLRLFDLGQPVVLTGQFGRGLQNRVQFDSGESRAALTSREFKVQGQGQIRLAVRAWYEDVTMSASGTGFLLEYTTRRKVTLPDGLAAASVEGLAAYEQAQKKSESFTLIDKFIQGPVVKSNETWYSFFLLDFNPNWVLGGGGNVINFGAGQNGTISHTDMHRASFSEARYFTWSQRSDGTLVYNFGGGIEVTARFIKPVGGGYQVLYAIPDPSTGMRYFVHDMFKDAPALTEAEVPGRYVFTGSDGMTDVDLVLHRDKHVSGVVGGYWFMDTNGDVVSYECYDKTGRPIATYNDCYNSFDNLAGVSFAHLRRLRFMHRDSGNNFLVKYDANLYGAAFSVTGSDYVTIAWTDRFKRIGDD